MASRPTYQSFVRHTGQKPKRSAMDCFSDGPFFRDGAMNRDGHGTPNPVNPSEGFGPDGKTLKEVHVYHHASPKD